MINFNFNPGFKDIPKIFDFKTCFKRINEALHNTQATTKNDESDSKKEELQELSKFDNFCNFFCFELQFCLMFS